ncbi:EamA family transporter [Frateuria hangzhouensis]|uniref:EamA family transporter n=1 Tax=Frateuria hangzhouensis TaxID=2995589 RepID=UPI002260E253|nr:EamA family transporter [Frateuria sp. STR12]MCX7514570.1 EamA family transporter [Frateuria sp. STR12]
MNYLFVALTILFTVYGQLVLKWQTSLVPPPANGSLVTYVVGMFLRPWVLSGLAAAFLASACWIAAISRFELSKVYPFMALNFVLVGLLAVPFFGESLSTPKMIGLVLVIAGLVITSRA